jgi:hypothetical protein
MSSTIIAIAVVAIIFILRASIKRIGSTAETVMNTSLEIVNQGANHLDKVVKVNILESTADIDRRTQIAVKAIKDVRGENGMSLDEAFATYCK